MCKLKMFSMAGNAKQFLAEQGSSVGSAAYGTCESDELALFPAPHLSGSVKSLLH